MAGLVHSNLMVRICSRNGRCFAHDFRIGLCVTKSFAAFCAISFVTSVTTVTPQLMLPLVGDLAPPHRRSTALSIVVSGMLLGMLIARLLSGVVTEFLGWRYIYWIAFGLQYLILLLLFLCMPDYPSTNPDMGLVRKYPGLLFDILRMPFKYPVLVQACLIGFFTSSIFTSYWTTLTFLLAGSPYHYSSLLIGLFALIGIGSMTWGPICTYRHGEARTSFLDPNWRKYMSGRCHCWNIHWFTYRRWSHYPSSLHRYWSTNQSDCKSNCNLWGRAKGSKSC